MSCIAATKYLEAIKSLINRHHAVIDARDFLPFHIDRQIALCYKQRSTVIVYGDFVQEPACHGKGYRWRLPGDFPCLHETCK